MKTVEWQEMFSMRVRVCVCVKFHASCINIIMIGKYIGFTCIEHDKSFKDGKNTKIMHTH